MAQMLNPTISIKRDKNADTVKATANCDVRFSAFEKNMMAAGARFTMRCELWGDDDEGLFGGGDSLRYTFAVRRVVQDVDDLIFSRTFKLGETLNEDDGNDEIYARFVLRCVDYEATFTERTTSTGGIHL